MEESEKPRLSWRDIILRYGLICGGMIILFISVLYLVDVKLIFRSTVYTGFLGMIIIAVLAAIKRKKNNEGTISYGDSVVTSLAVFSIGEAIYTLFMLLFYLVIDTSLLGKMKNLALEKLDQQYASGLVPNKAAYIAGQTYIENMNSNTILYIYISGFFFVIISGLLIFLLTSIFIKNESPFKKELA